MAENFIRIFTWKKIEERGDLASGVVSFEHLTVALHFVSMFVSEVSDWLSLAKIVYRFSEFRDPEKVTLAGRRWFGKGLSIPDVHFLSS